MKDSHAQLIKKRQAIIASVAKILGSTVTFPAQSEKQYTASSKVSSAGDMASALFSRVSAEYLESCPKELLAEISGFAFDAVASFKQGTHEVFVSNKVFGSETDGTARTVIVSILVDRPFIIDTIQETIRRENLTPSVIAHPIIFYNTETPISIAVADVPGKLDNAVQEKICDSLRTSYSGLFLVVDNYVEMRRMVKEFGDRYYKQTDSEEAHESLSLLNWLLDGGLIFIGASVSMDGKSSSDVGLFKSEAFKKRFTQLAALGQTTPPDDYPILCRKLDIDSPIHRFQSMDELTFFPVDTNSGKAHLTLIGLFTTSSMYREVQSIPVVRRRIRHALDELGLPPGSHDYKEILSFLDRIPKNEIFQTTIAGLVEDSQLPLSLEGRTDVSLRLRKEISGSFYSVLCVIPRGRFSPAARDQIVTYLEKTFKSKAVSYEHKSAATVMPLVVLHLLVPCPANFTPPVSEPELREEIIKIVRSWEDRVWEQLMKSEVKHIPYLRTILRSFRDEYRASTAPADAALDIAYLIKLNETTPIHVELRSIKGNPRAATLTLHKVGKDLSLSSILPVLENFGFTVLQEFVSAVPYSWGTTSSSNLEVGIHRFNLEADQELALSEETHLRFISSVKKILKGQIVNDKLNELTLTAGLTYMEVALLRTIISYLWQIKAISSIGSAQSAAVDNPKMAGLVVGCFLTWFNPATGPVSPDHLREQFLQELKQVSSIAADRALRAMLNVAESCLRTNFFKIDDTPRIALKINCAKILSMPKPRPAVEIFISSPLFEGVHLRGGKIARGGIRHSDREEDFRTEVLGLMKTQMVKNCVIVPVGAKGGFVIKGVSNPTPDYIREIYRSYVSSMLEITDNLDSSGKVIRPEKVVRYDEDDPYFVVAADKGTATYSDLANSIAVESFNFWLGDAFASGGSNGYDHKKLAITSRGVWETVRRHFREVGKDPNKDVITVTGIGDMSGDVFGNGLLRSKTIKLVAAFNHKHIFIDPNPDPDKSYDERLRLFNTPGSQWSDYDTKVMSRGSGIYGRADKEIKLSAEAAAVLGTTETTFSGEELVKTVLRAPVELLWNGGIGTYVKATSEDNSKVGDKTNDPVRIDAAELRCKVVGEGGNLGFTQLARLEYERVGGAINTDAVDNSGGVNTSDYEVNLKILLSAVEADGLLDRNSRNDLLRSQSEEICRRVIARNSSQSRAISVFQPRTKKDINNIAAFANYLEHIGIFDRRTESFPADDELETRKLNSSGLYRAELAVMIGFSKMWLKKVLLDSDLPEQPFLSPVLLSYFPEELNKKFGKQLENHRLKREIVSALIANQIVEDIGPTVVHRLAANYDIPHHSVAAILMAVIELLDLKNLKVELEKFDAPATVKGLYQVLGRIASATENLARWILDRHLISLSPADIVALYKERYVAVSASLAQFIHGEELQRLNDLRQQLKDLGMKENTVSLLASLPYALVVMDAVDVSNTLKQDPHSVALAFSRLYDILNVRTLVEKSVRSKTNDVWEESALRALLLQIRRFLSMIVVTAFKQGEGQPDALDRFCSRQSASIRAVNDATNAALTSNITLAKLMVIAQKLRALTNA